MQLGENAEPLPLEKAQKIYRKIWEAYQDEQLDEAVWNGLCSSPCWLGQKKNGALVWARVDQLVLCDNEAMRRLFDDRLTWWAVQDLKDLAQELDVSVVSQAEPVVSAILPNESFEEPTRILTNIWQYICWFLKDNAPSSAPKVYRVDSINVRYRIKGVESSPDESICSWYWPERETLVLTDRSGLGFEYELAEALVPYFQRSSQTGKKITK